MKKILIFLGLIQSFIIFSQEGVILPITSMSINVPNGTYYVDDDFLYAPYIGTWQGTWGTGLNTKIFSLKLEKVTHHLESSPNGDYYYYYKDIVIGKYSVTNSSTGNIIASTMNITNPNDAKISSLSFPNNDKFNFSFCDFEMCYNSGKIYTTLNPANLNELTFNLVLDDLFMNEGCPYLLKYDIPIPIPNVFMTLTKVN